MSWEFDHYTNRVKQETKIAAVMRELVNGAFVCPTVTAEEAAILLKSAESSITYNQNQLDEAAQKELEKAWKASPEYPMAYEAWKAKYESQNAEAAAS
jgi:hypothetical protein